MAEEAKTAHAAAGAVDGQPAAAGTAVTLSAFGQEQEREYPRQLIGEIVQARVEEILSMAMVEVNRAGQVEMVPAGLVLTGGTADLPGIMDLAEELTGLPARVGQTGEAYGLVDQISGAAFATGLAALRWTTDGMDPTGQSVRLSMPKAPGVMDFVRGVGRIGRVFLPQ